MVAKSRKVIFYLIAFSIPILFFVLLEYGLRAADYGKTFPLFIQAPKVDNFLLTSPHTVQRYFAQTRKSPLEVQIEPQYFRKEKPANGYRVFVQGGSSAAGFPYGLSASLAAMLEQRLRRTFAGKPIEVIGTAMSAVNSYTLLDYVDEIIAQKPDAVVIYAGHNEYVGVMGVGSMFASEFSRPVNLLMLKFKDLNILQLFRNTYAKWTQDNSAKPVEARGTVMARAARGKEIPYESELYQQGIEQFKGNMALILAKYQKAGIKVFISTLASNEKDLKPFKSGLKPSTDVATWQAQYQQALTNSDLAQALVQVKALIAMDDSSADAYYLQGQILYKMESFDEARVSFLAAKDRDQLRFRAPEVFNQVIRDLAQQYGAVLVDGQAKLRQNSPHQIIGHEFILEHLHPNLEGYFLLTEAFYEAFAHEKLIGDWSHYVPTDTARQEIPITGVDIRAAQYRINNLLSDYPFTDTPTQIALPVPQDMAETLGQQVIDRKIDWMRAHALLFKNYAEKGDLANATKVALMLADAVPTDFNANYTAADLLIKSKRSLESIFYLQRTLDANPEHLNGLMAMADMHMLQRDFHAAKGYLERANRINPTQPQIKAFLAKLTSMGY